MIDFNVIVQNLPFISGGLVLTFQLAGIAIGGGLCLGSLLSVARISGRPWIYYPATGKQNDFFVRKMIEIQNFSLWYDKNVQALCGINATIQRGQRLVICGGSGSGKSTLLRCINGLEYFQEGKILIDGVSVQSPETDIHRLRARIGMVFQHFELYPHMTVMQNITLAPMHVLKKSRQAAEAHARELLDRVDMLGLRVALSR